MLFLSSLAVGITMVAAMLAPLPTQLARLNYDRQSVATLHQPHVLGIVSTLPVAGSADYHGALVFKRATPANGVPYFFKRLQEELELAWAQDALHDQQLRLAFTSERLAELVTLSDAGAVEDVADAAEYFREALAATVIAFDELDPGEAATQSAVFMTLQATRQYGIWIEARLTEAREQYIQQALEQALVASQQAQATLDQS